MHANQLTVSVETVRRLVDRQFPQWISRTIWQPSYERSERSTPAIGCSAGSAAEATCVRTMHGSIHACSEHLLDVPKLRRIWGALRDLPRSVPNDVMTHGDLVPGNVLVSPKRLAGVIDVGGLGPADSALDLVCAWHLLEATPRQVLRHDLDCDDTEWARGKAWAFEQALGAVWYYN
jgi:aminoglycoside phosphotransferase (APT) family kinase protein